MGAFFASLFGANELADVELSWDTPNETDAALFNETAQLLERLEEMNNEINNYKGAKTEISAAMAASLAECGPPTRAAFDIVAQNAAICLGWMDTATIVATHLKDHILPHLKKAAPMSNNNNNNNNSNDDEKTNITNNNSSNQSNIELDDNNLSESSLITHAAICKQLCLILDHLLTFDQKKMVTSQIQNDFAFYKRTLSKTQEEYMKGCEITVNSEKAGFISMFLAQANPVIREISSQLTKNENLNVLGIFCNACLDLLKANKFKNDSKSSRMVVRAMLVAFLIYDHASDNGAFQRRSPIKAQKVCVMIVREYEEIYGNKDDVANLDNSLRWSTMHFADQTTPQSIKRLLAE